MIYIYNLEHPKECILFISFTWNCYVFFSNVLAIQGYIQTKVKASSPDIELGNSVTYVDIGQ